MVDNLLDQIMSPNIYLKTKFNIYSLSHSFISVKTSTYTSTMVSRLHPSTNNSSILFKKRGIYANFHEDSGRGMDGYLN